MNLNMPFHSFNIELPIDCIVESKNYIVLCGYLYANVERNGCVHFLDKNSLEIVHTVKTSGTLHAFYKDNRIYLANSEDISVLEENELIYKVMTKALNTYVYVDEYVYVSDEKGNITVYDLNLNLFKTISVTNEPIWVVKYFNSNLYFGNEKGECFKYNLETNELQQIGSKRLGIIDILVDSDNIIVTSYDDNVEIFDFNTLSMKKKIIKSGSLWKILKYNEVYFCASIYDGVKIFDSNFNLLKQIKVETICYGIWISGYKLIWADFYEKKINWTTLK